MTESAAPSESQYGPLHGLTVVELATEIQGPYAGLTLSELGAEVIKVEMRGAGDTSRGVTVSKLTDLAPEHANFSHYFYSMNRGKRSITLDMKSPQGQEVLWRLLERADILTSNFRIGVLERLGFGYDVVVQRCPRLIYAVASGWGPRGPRTQLPSRDMLAQAASGMMAKNGADPEPPVPTSSVIADYSGGHMLVTAVLAALYQRERTGKGQRVDVSLYGTMISLQIWELLLTSMTGTEPHRAGHGHPYMTGAWGSFRTADGWIVLSAVGDPVWQRFCEIIERPDLAADPQWTGKTRNIHGDAFRLLIADAFLHKTTAQWMAELAPADILATPAASYLDVLDDEQAIASGYIQSIDHPDLGPLKMVGSPIEFSGAALKNAATAPKLSADTDTILAELGYSAEQIEALRSSKAV